MCLAIVKPRNSTVPEQHIRNGWQINSDGGGFAYVRNNKVVISKGHMNLESFLAAYQEAVSKNKGSNFLLHFRIRSYGEKDANNTHPFEIPGGALIHNGSLSGTGAVHSTGPSDTSLFARKYGERLSFDFVSKHKIGWETSIGWNKMAMLYDTNQYIILNEKDGYWENEVWYSNYSYSGGTASYPGSVTWMDDLEDYRGALRGEV